MTAAEPRPDPGVPVHNIPMDRDPALLADPFRFFDGLRAGQRAFYNDTAPQPAWVLLRYDDIHEALQRYDLFSSHGCLDPPGHEPRVFPPLIPEELDPPEHTKYRQLLTPLFTPGRVKALEPSIRAHCVSLIEGFSADGECELVGQFARRYPTIIFMRLMGLPVADADTFLDWADLLMHSNGDEDPDGSRRTTAAVDIYGYLGTLLAERRAEPRDDILSYLLNGEVDGRRLDETELLQMAFLLYMAGLDTVAGALGYMFRHLADAPELRHRLASEPGAVDATVEELLRAYSIVTPVRVVTSDIEFAGCPMHAGDRVLLPTLSADRDDDEFAGALEVRVERDANRHVAFGAGPHRCLGSHLARLELRIALEEWHLRIPDYRVAEGAELRQHVAGVAGYDRLPLAW